jgi:hypothetical protein
MNITRATACEAIVRDIAYSIPETVFLINESIPDPAKHITEAKVIELAEKSGSSFPRSRGGSVVLLDYNAFNRLEAQWLKITGEDLRRDSAKQKARDEQRALDEDKTCVAAAERRAAEIKEAEELDAIAAQRLSGAKARIAAADAKARIAAADAKAKAAKVNASREASAERAKAQVASTKK